MRPCPLCAGADVSVRPKTTNLKRRNIPMRAVLTRVKSASVSVDGKTIGSIGPGFLILLGITHDDTEAQAVKLADKLTGLRIFEDEDGKMNRGLDTVNGEILVISQFTLYGNCRKGRRPEFLAAARPEVAIPLYEKFVALCREKGAVSIINDNVEIAAQTGADGVHVGQSDMEALDVRRKLGPDKIIGVSAQTVEQALLAEKHGADYLGVGAVFPTGSKDDADDVSYDTLKAICRAVSIPVVAIGGIHKENILQLKGTGVDGVALVSAIFAADDIETECRELKALSEQII